MKQFIIILSLAITGLINVSSFAQGGTVLDPTDTPRDGYYDKIHYPERRVVPYPYLREADVMYTKRVWRMIDMREKINQPLFYPLIPTNQRKNLMYVVMQAVEAGVKGYDKDDFKVFLTPAEIASIGISAPDTQIVFGGGCSGQCDTTIIIPGEGLRLENIKKFKIKEDWYFDRQRSVMEPRIIGICPYLSIYDKTTGDWLYDREMYWVYFPELRNYLVNEEVYNPYNFGARITYDDLFMKRIFNSLIYKIDNTYDRKIEDYAKGIDALLEAENIKDMIFKFEHDVWEQ